MQMGFWGVEWDVQDGAAFLIDLHIYKIHLQIYLAQPVASKSEVCAFAVWKLRFNAFELLDCMGLEKISTNKPSYLRTSKGRHQRNPSEQFNDISEGVGAAGNSLTMSTLTFWSSGLGCKATCYIQVSCRFGCKHCASSFAELLSNARLFDSQVCSSWSKVQWHLGISQHGETPAVAAVTSMLFAHYVVTDIVPTMDCAVLFCNDVFSFMIVNKNSLFGSDGRICRMLDPARLCEMGDFKLSAV